MKLKSKNLKISSGKATYLNSEDCKCDICKDYLPIDSEFVRVDYKKDIYPYTMICTNCLEMLLVVAYSDRASSFISVH